MKNDSYDVFDDAPYLGASCGFSVRPSNRSGWLNREIKMAQEFDEESFMNMMKGVVLTGFLFLLVGTALQVTAFTLEFRQFVPLLDQLAGLPKEVADNAPLGSEISNWKIEAAKFPPKLMTLKLVGVGSILTGIFLLLFVITQGLRVMPIRLGKAIRGR